MYLEASLYIFNIDGWSSSTSLKDWALGTNLHVLILCICLVLFFHTIRIRFDQRAHRPKDLGGLLTKQENTAVMSINQGKRYLSELLLNPDDDPFRSTEISIKNVESPKQSWLVFRYIYILSFEYYAFINLLILSFQT